MMSTDRDTLSLTLVYRLRENEGDWHDVREHIDLEATPCNYGGKRLWLTCHSCHSRRRVLYNSSGRFRCRACHNLAYTSTREDRYDRSRRRTGKLHKHLGASPDTGIFAIPEKPRGMHWETYERTVEHLRTEHDIEATAFRELLAKRKRLLASLGDRLE